MRDILFRGKAACGAWVQGDLIHRRIWQSEFEVIRVDDSGFDNYQEYEVATETIGQYTGLTDKNGKKIYEGDIVKYEYKDFRGEKCAIYLDVQYCEICGVYKPFGDSDDTFTSDEVEVIGNVFENPEMLEVK